MFETVVARYLTSIDHTLPGFVKGLYLVGSAATGAWQPDHSDIDALVITSGPADLTALARIHAGMPSSPDFDCVYLDSAALLQQPHDRPVVPFVVSGEFHADRRCGDLNPILWLTLLKYGIAVRGPAVADLGLTLDHEALRQYNLDNLREYWQPLAESTRAIVAEMSDDDPANGDDVAWLILGPARLHYTLANEDIIAKSAAAAYLAEVFPDWTELADRAARWRAGETVPFTVADIRASAAAIDAVADDAWARWG